MASRRIARKPRRFVFLSLIALLALGFSVSTSSTVHRQAGGIEVSGSLSEDVTWTEAEGPYIVKGNTTVVEGATLTVEAGVQVRFDGNHLLEIEGTLVARGTPDEPIVFTSNQDEPAPGDWDDITFWDTSTDYDPATGAGCILENVIVEYGGGAGQEQLVHIESAAPLIKNSVFRHGPGTGLRVQDGASPIVEGNTFANLNSGLWLTDGSNPTLMANTFSDNEWAVEMDPSCTPQFADNAATGNLHDGIRVTGGDTATSVTWYANLPYIPGADVSVPEGATLTIQAGAQVRFNCNCVLGVDGTLVARGTADEPILFTSNQDEPAPGDWDDITFWDTSVDYDPATGEGCIMENVIVEYGGGAGQEQLVHIEGSSPLIKDSVFCQGPGTALRLEDGASPIVDGNTFTDLNSGLWMTGGSNPTLMANTFSDNEWAVEMDASCNPQLAGSFATGNLHDGIRVTGGDTASAAIWNADLPYIPDADVSVPEDATLTIQAGAQVRFNCNCVLGVDGTLVARGTADEPILFTSNQDEPAPGDWDDITFWDTSVDYDPATGEGCIMENVIVEYGGGAGQEQLIHIEGSSPLIKDSVFRDGTEIGLRVQDGAAPVLQNNTFEDIPVALSVSD